MEPRLTVVTLGVKDLKRSLAFYKKGLGWPTKATAKDPIAFFQLGCVVLALFPRHLLAEDAHVRAKGSGFRGITLAHNVRTEAEVDKALRRVRKLGARIVKKAQKASWGGYSGYFADLDGHLWEVAHNPFMKLDRQGNPCL